MNSDASQDRVVGKFDAFLIRDVMNGVAWSPDGQTIVVPRMHGPRDIKSLLTALDLNGNTHELLPIDAFVGQPAWMPDGKSMLVPVHRLDLEGTNATQIWTLSFPDGKLNANTHDLTNYGPSLDITKDGRTIVAVEKRQISQVWAAPSGDTTNLRQLTTGENIYSGVREGPNGSLLLRRQGGDMETMKPGGSPTSFLQGISNYLAFTNCADRYVVFNNHSSRSIELWRADIDGSNAQKLADSVTVNECSPDGKWVLYHSGASYFRIPIEGGSPTEVLQASPQSSPAAISRDGNWIAYEYFERTPKVRAKMAVIPSFGRKPIRTFDIPGEAINPQWAHDDKGVQYLLTTKGVTNV